MKSETIGSGRPHENGDVEASHRHLKEAIEQALLLRGSREFSTRSDYADFLQQIVDQRNAPRQQRLDEELAALRPLPCRRLESYERVRTKVETGSLIHVKGNVYSVDSRLIGEQVEVRVYAERIEVWYAKTCRAQLPRLAGRGQHRVDYRDVIHSLIRKPRAFENYHYRESLFPCEPFREAYEQLRQTLPSLGAAMEYLQILKAAAELGEDLVADTLQVLVDSRESSPGSWKAIDVIAIVERKVKAGKCS